MKRISCDLTVFFVIVRKPRGHYSFYMRRMPDEAITSLFDEIFSKGEVITKFKTFEDSKSSPGFRITKLRQLARSSVQLLNDAV